MILLHVDAGGEGAGSNVKIAAAGGFTTIWQPADRVGQIESFRAFMEFILGDPSIELMLWLENDWASERPIPPIEFFRSFAPIEQFRMYGERKMKGDGPRVFAGRHIIGTKKPIVWSDAKGAPKLDWEFGRAHWGAGGTIVRPTALNGLLDAPRLKDVIVGANDLYTLRPRENYLWHIGENTTAGFFG